MIPPTYISTFLLVCLIISIQAGILYPKASKTRDLQYLDGLWSFSLNASASSQELSGNPNDKDIHLMPVPSSYNDILTSSEGRDHLGPVVYQKKFFSPSTWTKEGRKIWLRFGSVCYSAKVYINDKFAFAHAIGHLPFAGEITSLVNDDENTIKVIVDNTLTPTTIPQGSVTTLPGGRVAQTYTFDFFNYAGIDRPIALYTTPEVYIDDVTIHTSVRGTTGIVSYKINLNSNENSKNKLISYKVTVLDKNNNKVGENVEASGNISIPDAHLWWPYLMHDDPGYCYRLKVEIFVALDTTLIDSYTQHFGIRELFWNSTSVTINGKPIYIRGFGRHEDSDIRGKGLDLPLIIRDHNLMRWIGANAYRTSHYPYAEEIMDLADELGIMIIDETPAVNIDNISDALLENHKRAITELYNRDKNRPGVVIWSLANEPRSQTDASADYYKSIVDHMKSLDKTRPVTIVDMYRNWEDKSEQFVDIIFFNRYNAWYLNSGDLDTVVTEIVQEGEHWHEAHNKPVVVAEYGGDTMEGLHYLPAYVWSEEYQAKLLSQHFKAFDQLRNKGWFIGEMIWNFADFKTAQTYTRVGGNKKGIFTRQRQPKEAAHLVRRRYWALAKKLDNATIPSDLEEYFIDN
ncbi:beta-glucuronidase isoform X1 [Diabrotica virgifera virgifera]|uniref:Beta-glucuronidase n=1 Tax=Diabrotica virgifera virgifera TaxID=50390 RepID=A0ABM5KN61_DIAVI|nr:beta-glucuronidase isoform X1 [Diabrotica virgifera virgifera]